jgi:hypothetical protein
MDGFFLDTQNGFCAAELADGYLFQACLVQRKDKKGYKKEISGEAGWNDGICGDVNTKHRDWEEGRIAFVEFRSVCRKNGVKVS